MKLHRPRHTQSLQLGTAGMIDIVFLLLIFFLVNSSFRPVERQLESKLTDPSAATQAVIDPLVIRLERDEQGTLYRVGGRQFRQHEAWLAWLREWPDLRQPVMIVPQGNVPVTTALQCLNDCRFLGFENVAYVPEATREATPPW